jgi:medium-chain acyl-[acyl-carrier-protein] hydrolase
MVMSLNSAPERWVLRRVRYAPMLRLFCFCYAGGDAAVYLPWQAALGRAVEVCAIQLPGRGVRFGEPLLKDIESAVAPIARAIAPLQDRPFAFFGHSLGALLAYEVSHYLRASGAPLPRHLVVSGAQGPRLRKHKRQLHLLEDAELAGELERFAGTPTEVLASPELLELLLPILRADFRMAIEYTDSPRAPLPVPITVFAGRDDEFDDVAQYEDWFNDSSVSGELHWFDGGHFFINSAVGQVLDRLGAIITRSAKQ